MRVIILIIAALRILILGFPIRQTAEGINIFFIIIKIITKFTVKI